jgi:hypothetical protein
VAHQAFGYTPEPSLMNPCALPEATPQISKCIDRIRLNKSTKGNTYMKKILQILIIVFGLIVSNSFAQSGPQYSLGGTVNLTGSNVQFGFHFEGTLLPFDGLGVRLSTDIGFGFDQTSIDLLYITPESFYFGAGFGISTPGLSNNFRYGVFATFGYEWLLTNFLSVFVEARPIYFLDTVNNGLIEVPLIIGFRFRYIAV